MTDDTLTIRRANSADQTQWRVLWLAYIEFYKATLDAATSDLLWARIHDAAHPIQCLLAEKKGGGIVGLVHYFPHPSTWNEKPYCYLEDLFVDPDERGNGSGRALIAAVVEDAKKNGWSEVYWHTQQDNHQARLLYDSVTGGSDGFICYRLENIS